MTVHPVLTFPDPRLRAKAAPVTLFDAELRELAANLAETMRAVDGIGITACHIGIAKRVVVIGLPDQDRIYVNPEIVWAAAELVRHEEGSVSMSGMTDLIERPAQIRIRFQDLEGAERVEDAADLLSVCLQHEIDQLDGIFWIYRLSRLKRDRLIKRFEKLRRGA